MAIVDGDPVSAAITNAAFMYKNVIETAMANNSSSTGSAQDVTLSSGFTTFTNASLVSIRNISYSPRVAASLIAIKNGNGGSLTLINNTGGTAANRILTGTGADLLISNGSTAILMYDTVNSRWQVMSISDSNLAPSLQKQLFVANGTFTIPANTKSTTVFKFTVIGGGGGGAGGDASHGGGSGAGAGGTGVKWLSSLTPSATIAVTVGAGGAGGGAATGGSVGNNSTIASGTQSITTVTGSAGSGGIASGAVTNPQAGGAGGIATNGDLNISGQAGSMSVTYSAAGNGYGGTGGSSSLGGGGLGGNSTNSSAGDGGAGIYGAGGGGGGAANGVRNGTGGTGGTGVVIVEWVL